QWSAYTGLPATEALGWGWTQVIHEDDLSATVTGWNHALVAAADFVAELRLRRHDGTYRWHLARAVPMRGQLEITSWFGSLTDIHDQKVVQEELERLAGSLAVSEARYRTLVDAVPASIALMDTSGANTFHNRGWLEYTGATAEELREDGWQSFVHPEDRDQVLEQWRQAAASGEPYDSE